MILNNIEEIIGTISVFLPTGRSADLYIDEEGNIIITYIDDSKEVLSQDEFGHLIKEGIEVFSNQPTIAQQSVLMENNIYTDNERALVKKLNSFVGVKKKDRESGKTLFKNRKNTLVISDGTDIVTIRDNNDPEKQKRFLISTEERLDKLVDIAKGVFDLPVEYEELDK